MLKTGSCLYYPAVFLILAESTTLDLADLEIFA